MANHKSSKKRIRSTETKQAANHLRAKTMRNALRDFRTTNDSAKKSETLPAMLAKIDKLAKIGIIHKNKASNLKSKLMRQTNKIVAA